MFDYTNFQRWSNGYDVGGNNIYAYKTITDDIAIVGADGYFDPVNGYVNGEPATLTLERYDLIFVSCTDYQAFLQVSENTTTIVTVVFPIPNLDLATRELNNLQNVAINADLIPGVANTINLGSALLPFLTAYIDTLANGAKATTQLPGNNTTLLATTAYADAVGAASAPVGATYITQTPSTSLPNEQALSALTTGLMKSTTTTGIVSIAAAGTDYVAPTTTITVAGTPNEVTSSAGAQDLSTNRTWTLSLPSALTFTGKTITGGAYADASATNFTFTTGSIGTAVTAITQSAGTNNTTVATTAYADRMVPLAGGTMTGALVLNADPSVALGAVTKQYADAIASGIDFKVACYAATTVNLNATYTDVFSGPGATLINAGALVAFSVDGVTPPINSRILVKNQSTTFQNGIYVLTTVGSGVVAWVLTRATDYDQTSEIFPGTLTAIDNGTANALTSWVETATVTTIGSSPILFSQFTMSPVATPYTVSIGGTGVSTLTTAYGPLFAGTTATGPIQTGSPGTAGQLLTSNGAGMLPTMQTLLLIGNTYPLMIGQFSN